VSSKRFSLLFITIGLLVVGIFYGSSVQAQEYDCGTYSAGDYGEGECTDETTTTPTTPPTTSDPRDNPVTDGDNQPDTQTDGDTPLISDSGQEADVAREGEQRTDNSSLLWLGFGLLALLALIFGIWLVLRRRRDDDVV
jgi:hypothetical protein